MRKIFYILLFVAFANTAEAQWQLISTVDDKFTFWSVFFNDDSTGFVVGGYNDTATQTSRGVILKTLDGGQSWDTTYIDTIIEFRSVYFPSRDTGYATGGFGFVYKTIDKGQTWNLQITPANVSTLKSIFFTDNYTGYACSSDGENVFIKTINGGITWQKDSILLGGGRRIFFPSKNIGYVSNDPGGRKTIDGGNSWTTFYTNTSQPQRTFFDVHFLNDSVGYMSGIGSGGSPNYNFGTVTKTTDGGVTWIINDIQILSSISAIHFINENIGYAVGQANTTYLKSIIKTVDGGQNWGWQDVSNYFSSSWLLDIFCTNDSTCFAVGYGRIFKTTNGGGAVYTGITETKGNDEIKIYPNPADKKITVETNSDFNSILQIQIISVSGQILSNKNCREPGIKSIDVSDLTSGLYFVRIITNEKTETIKLCIQ